MCIFEAIRAGDADKVAEILATRGAEIHAPGPDGLPPLHLAVALACRGRRNLIARNRIVDLVIAHVLAHDASLINAPAARGRTALHVAACYPAIDIVNALLQAGADARIADARGLLPIRAAIRRDLREIVQLLLMRSVSENEEEFTRDLVALRVLAIRFRSQDIIALFDDMGVRTPRETLFDLAAQNALEALVELLETHTDLSVEDRNSEGLALLDVALMAGAEEVATLLLDRGYQSIIRENIVRYTYICTRARLFGILKRILSRPTISKEEHARLCLDAALSAEDDERACEILKDGVTLSGVEAQEVIRISCEATGNREMECQYFPTLVRALDNRCWKAARILIATTVGGRPLGALSLHPIIRQSPRCIAGCDDRETIELVIKTLLQTFGEERCCRLLSSLVPFVQSLDNVLFFQLCEPYIRPQMIITIKREQRVVNTPIMTGGAYGRSYSTYTGPRVYTTYVDQPVPGLNVLAQCFPLTEQKRQMARRIMALNLCGALTAREQFALVKHAAKTSGDDGVLFLARCGFNVLGFMLQHRQNPDKAGTLLAILDIWAEMFTLLKKRSVDHLWHAFAASLLVPNTISLVTGEKMTIGLFGCLDEIIMGQGEETPLGRRAVELRQMMCGPASLQSLALKAVLKSGDDSLLKAFTDNDLHTMFYGEYLWSVILDQNDDDLPFWCLWVRLMSRD